MLFDRSRVKYNRDRAATAAAFGYSNVLFEEICDITLSKLDFFTFPAGITGLNIGARDGKLAAEVACRLEVQAMVRCDLSHQMLLGSEYGKKVVVDEEHLPFASNKFDLIISTMSMHNTNDVVGVLIQALSSLKVGGVFIGTIFGPKTLQELRKSLIHAEAEMDRGVSRRIHPFIDVKDAGGLMQRAGFASPVADSEVITLEYQSMFQLLHDLRAMGEGSALAGRPAKPLTSSILDKAWQFYLQNFWVGSAPATFEVITITGTRV